MKKYLYLILLTILFIPKQVFAAGGFQASPSSISLNPGGEATITISTNNAVGLLSIESSNSGVASVSASSVFIQNPGDSAYITVRANGVGTATINVIASNNFATMDEDILGGQVRSVTVNVTNPAPPPAPNPVTPSGNNNNEPAKSSNTNIKDFYISEKEPTKVDDNNYTLTVSNSVTTVNIKANPEDSKSKIDGLGDHFLSVGENKIELTVTAESGATRKITITITRKEGYTIEDLDDLLKDKPKDAVDIIINKDTTISEDVLNKIKNSQAVVNLNTFDDEKRLIYSWQIDGLKLKNTEEFNSGVEFVKDYPEAIDIESNYAKGVNIHLNNTSKFPSGIKLKVYVGDTYKSDDIVNVYTLENNKLKLVQEKVKVDGGYITFEVSSATDYFITKSEVGAVTKEDSSYKVASIIEVVIILIMFLIILIMAFRTNKNKKSNDNITPDNITPIDQPVDTIIPFTPVEQTGIINGPEIINSTTITEMAPIADNGQIIPTQEETQEGIKQEEKTMPRDPTMVVEEKKKTNILDDYLLRDK